jgi:hypothetical protein
MEVPPLASVMRPGGRQGRELWSLLAGPEPAELGYWPRGHIP